MDHQSQLPPAENKFHQGNGSDGKHYWLTPQERFYAQGRYVFDREDIATAAGAWFCEAACPKRAARVVAAMNAKERA